MYVHIMAVYAGIFNGRKVCVRRAMHTDYDDVMRIDTDVYAGLDYLPVTYHESLTDPAARAYLTEIDNKVASKILGFWTKGISTEMIVQQVALGKHIIYSSHTKKSMPQIYM